MTKIIKSTDLIHDRTLIGDHTGGLHSFVGEDIYLANGWILRIPSGTLIDLNGQSILEGIAPDIYVSDDTTTTDVDEIIEKAFELLN